MRPFVIGICQFHIPGPNAHVGTQIFENCERPSFRHPPRLHESLPLWPRVFAGTGSEDQHFRLRRGPAAQSETTSGARPRAIDALTNVKAVKRNPKGSPRLTSGASTAVNVFCLSATFAEYVFYGPCGSLGAVADAQFAVQVAELSLDRIFADVQVFTELAIGHTGRK